MDIQKDKIQKQIAPLAVSEEEALHELVTESTLIFVGTVTAIGPAPGAWSGYASAYQTVTYEIERIMKGQYGAKQISIHHIIVLGSKTAIAGEEPGLSPSLFSVGSQLIVSARKTESGVWKDVDETLGALPNSPEWIKKVESNLPIRK